MYSSLLGFNQREEEFVELCLIDSRGGIEHHVAAGIVLREGDIVTNRLHASEQRAQAVEAECQTSVRGCTELEGIHQEAELLLSLLGCKSEALEDSCLQLRIVDTNRATTNLGAVAYEVISIGPLFTQCKYVFY